MAEISFDEEDFETEDEDEDDESNAHNETDEGEGMEGREESSNRSEGSDTNDGDVRNEAEDVTTGTDDDEEAGSHCASINRNRMLDLEGWFLGEIPFCYCMLWMAVLALYIFGAVQLKMQ